MNTPCEQKMLCPKCRIPLNASIREGASFGSCDSCQGIWVNFMDEKQLLEVKPESFTVDELRRLRRAYAPLGKPDPVQYVPCPVCSELMTRKNWGSHSGVIVDKCEKHGTWYDRGELDQVKTFIRFGGVEYEKLKLTEKGLDRLESKLGNEISRVDRKIDSAYMKARIFSMLGL